VTGRIIHIDAGTEVLPPDAWAAAVEAEANEQYRVTGPDGVNLTRCYPDLTAETYARLIRLVGRAGWHHVGTFIAVPRRRRFRIDFVPEPAAWRPMIEAAPPDARAYAVFGKPTPHGPPSLQTTLNRALAALQTGVVVRLRDG
jgi:hypothetical protein